MLKFLIITILALHCNCQKVIEIGSRDDPIKVSDGVPVVSSVRTVGGFSTFGQPIGATVVQSPAAYGYGVNSIGGLRQVNVGVGHPFGASVVHSPSVYGLGLSSIGGLRHVNYGVGQPFGASIVQSPSVYGLGLSSIGGLRHVNYGVVRPSVGLLAAVQPTVQTVVAQPAAVAVQPAVQTVAVARPAVYAQQVHQVHQPVAVSAAIQQVGRTVEYRPVPYNDQPAVPQVVEVEPSDVPIHLHFKSRSSTVQLTQEHIPGAPGTVEHTSSQDEPSKVIHEVVKPVIQEVREVIQPYRQVSQEVQPVVENVHTIVSKGEGVRSQYVQQYVAQPYQQVAQIQAVAQPVAQIQTIAQPVAQYQTIAQPVVSAYQVAQPVVSAIAQPYGVQAYRSIVQPAQQVVAFGQHPSAYAYRSIVQPAQQVVVSQQPSAYSVIGSGSLLNSGLLPTRHVGLGGAYLTARSHPVGGVSYRTYAEQQ